MLCREIMKSKIACVQPDESVMRTAQKMRDHHVGFIPICDDHNRVVGTLTDRDIAVRVVADGLDFKLAVRDVMTDDIVACSPEDDVEHALELMREHQKSRMLITNDDGRLVGVISLSDIAQQSSSDAADTLREVTRRESHEAPSDLV